MGPGGEGKVPPPASSQAGEQPAQPCCCPFIYWTRNNSHTASRGTGLRNVSTWPTLHYLGQEQRTLAVAATPLLPILYWGHVWNQPFLGLNACVLARSCILSPLPNKLSAEAVRPSPPIPCNTHTRPDLPTCLPFPCSSLSSVRFVSFWAAGGDVNAPWTLPFSQPRPA